MFTEPNQLAPATIHLLTVLEGLLLLVFKDNYGYHFRVVNFEGNVFGQSEFFSTAIRAEREGRRFIRGATR